ncbi:hypothetical protein AB9M62_36075 [Bacillales bacterium AN1005]
MSDLEIKAASENMACASSYEDIYPLVIDPFGLNAFPSGQVMEGLF